MVRERWQRTFSSLSIYNYRLFWVGQLVSLSGTWMQTTAQGWLVLKLTDSPTALGTVAMVQFLPIMALTLFGGVLADRLPKRALIICTQSIAAVQALVMAALVLSNTIQLWQIYLLALVLGLVNAFDTPTRQAFVAEMVGKEHLQNAVALNSSLFNAARVVGPAIGGVVISAVGIGQAFLLNGVSFLPVIAGLLLMRRHALYSPPRSRREPVLRQLVDGVRYAVNTREVLAILVMMAVLGTFGYNFTTILPLIARYVLHSGAIGLGLLTSAMGLGALGAALAVAGAGAISERLLLVVALLFGGVLMLVGLSSSLPLTLGLLGLLGAVSIAFNASANTRLQMNTPGELRGRVMSLYFLLFAGTTPIGSLLVGLFAAHIGVQPMVLLMGLICLVGVVATLPLARRRTPSPLEPREVIAAPPGRPVEGHQLH